MSIDIIVQARLGSKRLPKKVLMKIGNKTMLHQLISRLKKTKNIRNLIVATSINHIDNEIIDHCKKISGVCLFRGSEENVLERYYKAALKFNSENIIRITADCPMIDSSVIEELINLFSKKKYDYVSNSLPRTFPDGLDCEIFSFKTLEYAFYNAKTQFSKEHVTPYIRGVSNEKKKKKFKLGNISFLADFSKIRWTVDYREDLERMRKLFEILPENFSWLDALSVGIEKPELLGLDG